MSDRKIARKVRSGIRTLPEGLLMAALYAVACWSTRQVSLDQFLLPAGIRIAALLIIPFRMWPYLLLGDYLYLSELRLPMLEKYGAGWVALSSIYQFPTAAAVVYLHRQLIIGNSPTSLISVAATAAILIGVGNLALAHLFWPAPPDGKFSSMALRYALGHYIAIMTLAPLALLWARRGDIDWASWRRRSVIYAVSALAVCGALSTCIPHGSETERAVLQLMVAGTVIALTCLLGWWGAAVAMPLTNLFIWINTSVSGLPGSFDPESFQLQLIVAISGTALLAFGSRITHHFRQYREQASAKRQAINNARSSHSTHERELRNRVLNLRRIGDGLDASLSSTVEWLRAHGYPTMASELLHAATLHSREFREQTSMLYPTIVEHVGLYLALEAGGIADVWDQRERFASPHLVGDPCQLSLDLQLTAYRALSEAVSLILEREHGSLKIRARCGRLGSVQGMIITIGAVDRRQLLSRTTTTMAIGRLSGRTQAYGGTVHCRRNRIRLSFAEPSCC